MPLQQWDLNTGSLSRSYPAGNQIASLAFRPTGNSYTPSLPATPQENDRDSSTEADAVGEEDSDPDDIAAALKPQVTSVDGTVSLPPTPSPLRKFADALNPSLPELSQDVLLCSSFDGQVTLYDRRAKEAAMRKFGMDKNTAPWAMQAS